MYVRVLAPVRSLATLTRRCACPCSPCCILSDLAVVLWELVVQQLSSELSIERSVKRILRGHDGRIFCICQIHPSNRGKREFWSFVECSVKWRITHAGSAIGLGWQKTIAHWIVVFKSETDSLVCRGRAKKCSG